MQNVAIYLRLSKDDGDKEESESIKNQREIIIDFIEEHNDMHIYNEYIDDGYSGANFNRPGFKRMMDDIEKGKIDIVITKNLARFGRNHIESGEYIEKYFPNHNIRYIAILDKIDTFNDITNMDFMPIKAVFNEKFCKDTSVAVKNSKRKKMKEGYYACNTAPFGYKKDMDNPGRLIVDDVSSMTVKKIFELKGNGFTIKEIVKYLEDNNYKTPAEYMNIKGLENIKKSNIWRCSSVQKILSNQVYLGHCIRGKTQNISYKSKDRIHKKRKEYIITYNTHEPIISEDIFKKVHANKKYGCEILNREKDTNLLHGLIFCKDCGRKLVFLKRREKIKLYCSSHYENSELCHNKCNVDYQKVEHDILKYIIEKYKEYFSANEDRLHNIYYDEKEKENKKELEYNKYELESINKKITILYNKRLSEMIKESEYKKI